MIEFQNVGKSFGGQVILRDASFRIHAGERVGVVGPNGAGKSTVFDLICGEATPDSGRVNVRRDGRLGYLRQHPDPRAADETLLDFALLGFAEVEALHKRIEALEEAARGGGSSVPPDRATALRRLGELQTRFEQLGGYATVHRAEAALSGMGFAGDWLRRPLQTLSGGWRMRAELVHVLLSEPDALLLDEPSNYLDIPAVEWLQRFLKGYAGTLVLISHDRYLLNTLTDVTLEIANGGATRYEGSVAAYVKERELRVRQLTAAARNQDRRRAEIERFIERFRAKNTRAAQVQSRIKALEKMERIEAPRAVESAGAIRVARPPHSGLEVVRLEGAGVTYDGERWVLRNVDLRVQRGEKVALVGSNGLGKTTLMRMIAGRLPLSEGRRVAGHRVAVGYQAQESAETMDVARTVLETVRAAAGQVSEGDVRTLLGSFGFSGDAVEKPVGVLSGGERIRLAFARLLIHPPNFLVLDEPTTHLDLDARRTLEEALRSYEGTLCVVSHDIEFVRRVADVIVAMTPPGITRHGGDYDYYLGKTTAAAAPPTADGRRETAPGPRAASRHERAQRVQRRAALRRPLERQVADTEESMHRLDAEATALTEELARGDGQTDYAGVGRRLAEVRTRMDTAARAWESASLKLEDLTRAWAAEDAADAAGA